MGDFAIGKQTEPVGMGEAGTFARDFEFEGLNYAVERELGQLIEKI